MFRIFASLMLLTCSAYACDGCGVDKVHSTAYYFYESQMCLEKGDLKGSITWINRGIEECNMNELDEMLMQRSWYFQLNGRLADAIEDLELVVSNKERREHYDEQYLAALHKLALIYSFSNDSRGLEIESKQCTHDPKAPTISYVDGWKVMRYKQRLYSNPEGRKVVEAWYSQTTDEIEVVDEHTIRVKQK